MISLTDFHNELYLCLYISSESCANKKFFIKNLSCQLLSLLIILLLQSLSTIVSVAAV